MVGVIGVGSYAAYQAHKGMNMPTVAVVDEAKTDAAVGDLDAPPLQKLPDDALAGAEPIQLSTPAKSQRQTTAVADNTFDELDQPATKATSKKNAAATKRSAQILPVNQKATADFGSDDPIEEVKAPKRPRGKDLAVATTDDTGTKAGRQQIRQISATIEEEETPAGEIQAPASSDDNSFVDDATNTAADVSEPAATDLSAQSEPEQPASQEPVTQEPAKAQQFSEPDFDSAPPPVLSNRAKKKRQETASEADTNNAAPFDDGPAEPAAASATTSKTEAQGDSKSEAAAELSVPAQAETTAISEPVTSAPPASEPVIDSESSSPAKLPQAPPSSFEDDAPAKDTIPARKQIPALPSSLEPADRPAKKKSMSPRRSSDYDRVMPVDESDMVGDGVVGDASLRGVQQPRLTIEKVAQQQAVLDQPLVYTIIVKNTGTVDAHNIVIEDRIPKGTELQGTAPQAELAGKRLLWNQKLLKPNEEKRISIKVIPKQEGPVGSVARVYFATEVTAEIVVAAPQLDFTVKAPREVRLGQQFDVVFLVRNTGKVEANNVIIRDIVPPILNAEKGDDIECMVGKLAPGESREIVLNVTAAKTGSVRNQAYLQADSGIKKQFDSDIDVIGEVLVLTRSGHNRLYVERPAVFTNSIRNDGNQRAESVKISEVVPAGMEFDSASDGGRFDPNLRAVVWTLGPLPPGGDKQVTVKYVPKETGTHPAKITASGAAGSTASINAGVEVVGKPELQMETLTATGVVTLGDRITSRFQLNNTGTAPANNVQLRIQLPQELRLVSVKGTKLRRSGNSNEVLFDPILELAPRSKVAYELVLEPISEADAQIVLEISADHMTRPGRRIETIQIARDALKE